MSFINFFCDDTDLSKPFIFKDRHNKTTSSLVHKSLPEAALPS